MRGNGLGGRSGNLTLGDGVGYEDRNQNLHLDRGGQGVAEGEDSLTTGVLSCVDIGCGQTTTFQVGRRRLGRKRSRQ